MITVRAGDERGRTVLDWLDSRHTFSFDRYHDPRYMGFRALRVINEDRVQPGRGFGTHGHQDMEILSYALEGALEHRDSLGTGSVIRPGELQRMTAGTGVTHSEFNPSRTDLVHFLQIWILPERTGLQPGYEQKAFPESEKRGRLCLVASRDGREGSVIVHQDVRVYAAVLEAGQQIVCPIDAGRHAWVQVARGAATLNGHPLRAGDGAAVSGEPSVEVGAGEATELLLIDLA